MAIPVKIHEVSLNSSRTYCGISGYKKPLGAEATCLICLRSMGDPSLSQTYGSLPQRLRQKSKGWKLVNGKFLSETPQLLIDAASEIEKLEGQLSALESAAEDRRFS
jgi:hypothetical protein